MLLNHWLSFFNRTNTLRSKVARGTKRSRQLCVQSLETRIVLANDFWTGTKDTNWQNPLNWTNGVPTTGDSVFLGLGQKNQGITNVSSVDLNVLQIDDPAYTLAQIAPGTTLGFTTLNIGNFNFTFNMNVRIETQGGTNASINLPGNQRTTLTINGETLRTVMIPT